MVDRRDEKSQGLKRKVEQWLRADGWQVSDLGPGPESLWAIQAGGAAKRILVAHPKDFEHQLVVETLMRLAPASLREFQQLEPAARHKMLSALSLDLIRADVNFFGVQDPVEDITFQRTLYAEDLTRTRFFDALRMLDRGIGTVSGFFGSAFGRGPASPEN